LRHHVISGALRPRDHVLWVIKIRLRPLLRDWEARFAPLLADQVRRRRQGKVGRCWHVDETYIKVSGRWVYLYRAIDKQGQLIDSMLSAKRDMAAAQRFFQSAKAVAGRSPEQVTTDGHGSYPRAIAEVLGKKVQTSV